MTSTALLVTDAEWLARAAALAATVVAGGELADPAWAEVFAAVPRHVFIPRFFRRDTTGDLVAIDGTDPAQRGEWLDAVYSDTALTTQLGQIDPGDTLRPLTVSASSSTRPTLMARMLADLHADTDHRVLEIGTGTGYNAALLCHRLSDRNVCSIDIPPGSSTPPTLGWPAWATTHAWRAAMAPTAGRSTPPTTGSLPPAGLPRSPTRGLPRPGRAD